MPVSGTSRRIGLAYRLLVGLTLFVGLFLRVFDLVQVPPGLHFDEAVYGLQALEIVHGARPVFFSAYTGREPLYMYVMAGFIAMLGQRAWTIRLTSAFIGVVTIALTASLARRLYGRYIAVAAAGLLSLSYWHLTVSRNGYPNILIPPIECAAAYFLWRGLEAGRARHWAAGGALTGLVLYTYLAARFWPIVLTVVLLAALVVDRRRLFARWPGLLLAGVAAVLVFTPLALHFATHPADFLERANQVLAWRVASGQELVDLLVANARRSAGAFLFEGQGDPRWHYNLPGRPILAWPVAGLFILGIAVCSRRGRDLRYLLPLVWIVVSTLPGVLTAEMQPAGQRMFGMFPALVIVPAIGLERLGRWLASVWGWIANRPGRSRSSLAPNGAQAHSQITTRSRGLWTSAVPVILAAVVLLADGRQTWQDYFDHWAKQPETYHIFNADYAVMADRARTDLAAGETVVILSQHHKHPTVAYLAPTSPDAAVWAEPLLALPMPAPRGQITDTVVYYRVTSYLPDDAPAARLLNAAATTIERFHGPGEVEGQPLDVVRYVVPRRRWPRLDGGQAIAEIHAAGDPNLTGERGRNARVALRWTVDAVPPAGRAFAVHLEDGNGWTWSQADALGYISDQWQPGDEVVSWYDLKLARDMPPGEYHARLIVTGEDGAPIEGSPSGIDAGIVNVEPGHGKSLKEGQSVAHDFGDGLALVDFDSPQVENGDGEPTHIKLDLHWARTAGATPPSHFSARLDGATGQRYDLGSVPISAAYPPQSWEEGELLHNRYRLAIPETVPQGDYDLLLATSDGAGMAFRLDRIHGVKP